MKRREFLVKSIHTGVLAGAALSTANIGHVFGTGKSTSADLPYDLVAVRGGSPAEMFDRAIASMGGMSKFVKKNQTVVVKPNIGWDAPPERAANTNPALVKRIIEHCLNVGAKEVYVFDNTCNEWTKCYRNSGIENAVKDAGGKMVTGKTKGHYQEVTVPRGKSLHDAQVHELILDSDVFINVPVLKSHGGAKLTIAMKNLMGIVWDRRYWHANNLHQCIADFPTFKKPDLNVVDAYRVLKRNGPRGVSVNDVVMMHSLLLSTDIVAVDTAATKLFGYEIEQVPYIQKAEAFGLGTTNLQSLNINRIKI